MGVLIGFGLSQQASCSILRVETSSLAVTSSVVSFFSPASLSFSHCCLEDFTLCGTMCVCVYGVGLVLCGLS